MAFVSLSNICFIIQIFSLNSLEHDLSVDLSYYNVHSVTEDDYFFSDFPVNIWVKMFVYGLCRPKIMSNTCKCLNERL